MCGFVCLWHVGDADLASRMIARISHRGPDATEVVGLDGGDVTMAHCRLAVIGPEDGASRSSAAATCRWRTARSTTTPICARSSGAPASRRRRIRRRSCICSARARCAGSTGGTECSPSCRRRGSGWSRRAIRSASSRCSWRAPGRAGLRERAEGVRRHGPRRDRGDSAGDDVRQARRLAAVVPRAAGRGGGRAGARRGPGGA